MTTTPGFVTLRDGNGNPFTVRVDVNPDNSLAMHSVAEVGGAGISTVNPMPASIVGGLGNVTLAGAVTLAGGQSVGVSSLPALPAGTNLVGTVKTQGTSGLGALAAVPSGSTDGTALGSMPSGAVGARIYLPTGASVTFTVAGSQPGSAPSATFTASASVTGPNWDENLAGGQMIYVTAITGSPLFRWF